MHKIKKIIKNNSIIIFLLVAIAIVTNIAIVYTFIYVFSDKGKNVEEINIKNVSQKSPIVIEVLDNAKTDNNLLNENQENYPTGNTRYYIKVNLKTQTVNIYEKDELNRYSIPVKTMLCSTGEYTPKSGTYKITTYKQEWLSLQGNVYGQYCTQIVGNILFHSVPYVEKYNPASLEYWEYDKLGQDVSLGCIRLTVENAKWIFDNCDTGTRCRILFIRRSRTIWDSKCRKDIRIF